MDFAGPDVRSHVARHMNIVLSALDDTESETTIIARDESRPDGVRPLSVVAESDPCVRDGPTCFVDDHTLSGDKPDVVWDYEIPDAHAVADGHDDPCCARWLRHARVEHAGKVSWPS